MRSACTVGLVLTQVQWGAAHACAQLVQLETAYAHGAAHHRVTFVQLDIAYTLWCARAWRRTLARNLCTVEHHAHRNGVCVRHVESSCVTCVRSVVPIIDARGGNYAKILAALVHNFDRVRSGCPPRLYLNVHSA